MKFDYIKCPLNRWTFKIKNIREWVEKTCEGKVLNLFAGITKLNLDETRNDVLHKCWKPNRYCAYIFYKTTNCAYIFFIALIYFAYCA